MKSLFRPNAQCVLATAFIRGLFVYFNNAFMYIYIYIYMYIFTHICLSSYQKIFMSGRKKGKTRKNKTKDSSITGADPAGKPMQ